MRLSPICLAILSTACITRAATPTADWSEITRAQAQEILRATPAAIPGYPVTFLSASGDRVLVRQVLDSGRVVDFIEEHDRPNSSYGFQEPPEHAAQELLAGRTTYSEKTFVSRQMQRRVGEVRVQYLGGWSTTQSELAGLLDRLAPIS